VIAASLYPYALAAHVTAAAVLVGGVLAHDRMVSAVPRDFDQQLATLTALVRLDRSITTPALLLTWSLGVSLALWGRWLPSPWLLAKLCLVVAVSALHGVQTGRLRRSLSDKRPAEGVHGAGAAIIVALSAIATLAVVKPG
jgi:putative membrane protein